MHNSLVVINMAPWLLDFANYYNTIVGEVGHFGIAGELEYQVTNKKLSK